MRINQINRVHELPCAIILTLKPFSAQSSNAIIKLINLLPPVSHLADGDWYTEAS